MAVREMIELCDDYAFAPEVTTANSIFVRKSIAAESLQLTVEKALEIVGGGGLFRSIGLERLLRDIYAAQFHPLQAKRQHRFTGRLVVEPQEVTAHPISPRRRGSKREGMKRALRWAARAAL
jgi:alkylation response protein AidB-like acyl-CoA dehydrogenase